MAGSAMSEQTETAAAAAAASTAGDSEDDEGCSTEAACFGGETRSSLREGDYSVVFVGAYSLVVLVCDGVVVDA